MHLAVITNGHKSCKYLRCANIHADAAAVRRHHEPPPRNWGWALRGREVSTARPRPALEQPRTAIIGMSGRVLLILTYFISYCIEGRDSSIKHMNIYERSFAISLINLNIFHLTLMSQLRNFYVWTLCRMQAYYVTLCTQESGAAAEYCFSILNIWFQCELWGIFLFEVTKLQNNVFSFKDLVSIKWADQKERGTYFLVVIIF